MSARLRARPRFAGLWRHHDFLRLWTGQTISVFGSLVGGFALSMTAIIVLEATPFQVTLLSVAQLLPGLLVGLFAGVWVDRLRRRPILIWADIGRAVVLGSIPVAALLGVLHIEQLYVVALLVSVLSVFFDVAYRSYLPSLVSREELIEGNSKLQASGSAAEAAGFGVAGVLVQALSAPTAILVDSLSFLVSACSVALIRTAEPSSRHEPAPAEEGSHVWGEIGQGLQLVVGNPMLRAIAETTGMFHLFQNIIGVVIMLFFIRELHLSVALMGPLFALGGLSSLCGAAVTERTVRAFGLGRTLLGSLLLTIGAALCIPLAGGGPWLVVGLLAAQQLFGDGAATVYEISQTSLIQATTPQHLQGRVSASIHVIEGGAAVAGFLIGGALGQTIGLRPTLVVGCLGALLAACRLAVSRCDDCAAILHGPRSRRHSSRAASRRTMRAAGRQTGGPQPGLGSPVPLGDRLDKVKKSFGCSQEVYMLPAPRLLALLLVGALLLGWAGDGAVWLLVALVYLFVVAGIASLDWRRTPVPGALRVERHVEARLSLGAVNPVTVTLVNRSRFPLQMTVRDEPPPELVSDGEMERLTVQPGGTAALHYTVRPPRRGDFAFGRVNVRYRSLLGLFDRQGSYALAAPVKVYPNLREVRKYDLAARSGLLQEAGLRRVRRLGSGTEFERLRDYHPDDDYRRINWPATARRGRPITIDYQTERAQNVLVMLDVGRLMAAPVGFLSKLDFAVNTALLLSYVCLRRGDNVGLLAFADREVVYLAARGGMGQFKRLLEALYNVEVSSLESDYTYAFNYAGLRLRRRSLMVTFTDVASPEASRHLVGALARAATRHLPICATLRDPIVAAYAEAPIRSSAAVYERAIALTLIEARRATLRILAARGVITLDVAADQLSPAVIDEYLSIKARGRL